MPLPIHPDPVQSFPPAHDPQDAADRPFNFSRQPFFDELAHEDANAPVALPPPPPPAAGADPDTGSGMETLQPHLGAQAAAAAAAAAGNNVTGGTGGGGPSGSNLALPGLSGGGTVPISASPSAAAAAAAAASLQPIGSTSGASIPSFLSHGQQSFVPFNTGHGTGGPIMLVPPGGPSEIAETLVDERDRSKLLPTQGIGLGSGSGIGAGSGSAGLLGSQDFTRRLRATTRTRSQQMTESERKQRHNQHTRASRSRIDRGLERLKSVIRKVRPQQKVTKKADVLHEAVKLLEERFHLTPTESDDERDGPQESSLSV